MISRFTRSFAITALALLFFASLTLLHSPTRAYIDPLTGTWFGEGGVEGQLHAQPVAQPVAGPAHGDSSVHGAVIMSKLGNETAKAALGRATWKLLHTMTLRYPEKPTEDERSALDSYFHLFSRLYPCGECAAEFQKLLKRFPPQTSSRRSASLWLCHVHNQVNERLHKPIFDCAHLDDTYDCGCGDDAAPASISHSTIAVDPMDLEHDPSKDDLTGIQMIKGGR